MGFVEAIFGPMFSGKTRVLIERLRHAEELGASVVAVKPATDARVGEEIASLSGARYPAVIVSAAEDVPAAASAATIVGIDEAQFFDENLPAVVRRLRDEGHTIYVAGLDLDFRGEAFGSMPAIMESADVATSLAAECAVCGGPARRTQRLLEGAPAARSTPTVVVGGRELYEPRCLAHHVV